MTGGARGIGRAICEAYVAEGAKVAVADRLAHEAEETAAALGENAMAVTMDVTDLDAIAAGVAAVEAKWGGIDILSCQPDSCTSRNGTLLRSRSSSFARSASTMRQSWLACRPR